MNVEIMAVIIGWLLGILSTPLVIYISGEVERRRFKDVLKEELREVRFRLALSAYQLRLHLRKIDRSFLEWMVVEMNAYTNDPLRNSTLEVVRSMLRLSNEDLLAINSELRNPVGTKSFPKVILPYLSSKTEAIALLCSAQQKELVNLLHYVETINVKSTELAEWNVVSFQIDNNENHARASRNADGSIQAISDAAEKSIACIKNYFKLDIQIKE